MGNILDRFKDFSVGSSGRIMDYQSTISASGDFSKLFDMDAILVSWNNILTTPKGSMNHDPLFGSNLYKFIFEPCDDLTKEAIQNEISSCLLTYDDRATISSLTIDYYTNNKGFTVSMIVNYNGNKSKLSLSMDETTLNSLT